MARYAMSRRLDVGFEEALKKAVAALEKEGFGILCEIDVKATLKKKLDREFRRYVILGACNPQYAHQALTVETEIGLLLPCNVIVYENDEGTATVSAVDPVMLMGLIDNPALALVAKEVKARLEKAINAV